jgi:hypothetical protein
MKTAIQFLAEEGIFFCPLIPGTFLVTPLLHGYQSICPDPKPLAYETDHSLHLLPVSDTRYLLAVTRNLTT